MSAKSPMRWSVIGVGRAGQARARAIQSDPNCSLVATYRGKNAERFVTVPQVASFAEAVDVADAVAICSPDAVHPEQVEAALTAGRHVVCEYPVAPNAREALRLLQLAKNVGRILHVEHIELLHAPQAILKAHCRPDPVAELRQEFSRNGSESVPAEQMVVRNLARVHRMIDLCGSVVRVEALKLEPGLVTGRLIHRRGGTSNFVWQQSPYLQRFTKMKVRTRSGEEWRLEGDSLYRGRVPQTLIQADPLFEQDHRAAMARIEGRKKGYVEDGRLIHGLQVMRRIAEGREGDVGSA